MYIYDEDPFEAAFWIFAGAMGLIAVAHSAWLHGNHKPFLHALAVVLSVSAILWGTTYT
jgi:hypothetical protein